MRALDHRDDKSTQEYLVAFGLSSLQSDKNSKAEEEMQEKTRVTILNDK